MSKTKETVITTKLATTLSEASLLETCPVCGRESSALIPFAALDNQLRPFVEANALLGSNAAVCEQCIDLFERGRKQIEAHGAIFEQTSYVLPTPLRLSADERFTGRGVTIAFLTPAFMRTLT